MLINDIERSLRLAFDTDPRVPSLPCSVGFRNSSTNDNVEADRPKTRVQPPAPEGDQQPRVHADVRTSASQSASQITHELAAQSHRIDRRTVTRHLSRLGDRTAPVPRIWM